MVLAAIFGYLIGSFPTAQIIARLTGVDPLRQGDGNPGWWNMRELVGERAAFAVLLGDVMKGALAAGVGLLIATWTPWWTAYIAVLFAMIGHAFPLFAGLRGGRALLTWAGGMLVLSTPAALVVITAGLLVAVVLRRQAWGARLAAFAFPFVQLYFDPVTHVALTGVLMTFIGLRFLFARTPASDQKTARRFA